MKKINPQKGPTVTRTLEVQLVAKYFQDGIRVGEDVRLANADVVFVGPTDADDPLGAQYILGATRLLKLEPPVAFTTHNKAEFEHVMDLAGKEVRWGKQAKKRPKSRR